MPKQSAIPDFYFAVFAWYEPFLCLVGFVGALFDPKTVSFACFSLCDNYSLTEKYPRRMTSKRHGHSICLHQIHYLEQLSSRYYSLPTSAPYWESWTSSCLVLLVGICTRSLHCKRRLSVHCSHRLWLAMLPISTWHFGPWETTSGRYGGTVRCFGQPLVWVSVWWYLD